MTVRKFYAQKTTVEKLQKLRIFYISIARVDSKIKLASTLDKTLTLFHGKTLP